MINLHVVAQTSPWKSLSEKGYTLQYPEHWDLDNSGRMGLNVILLTKLATPQDQFRENVNLMIQDLAGQNIDLNKFVEISESQIKTILTNGNILESKRESVNDKKYQKLVYTADQGIYKLKFEQYYFVENEKAYVLTLTCEADQFNSYREEGEKILKSFRLVSNIVGQ
jgi:hypothetical protein